MTKRKLPTHIPGTIHDWRLRKRREWRALMTAAHTFLIGCAYTPVKGYGETLTHIREAGKRLSVKEWGK